jgi:hypothetical protein
MRQTGSREIDSFAEKIGSALVLDDIAVSQRSARAFRGIRRCIDSHEMKVPLELPELRAGPFCSWEVVGHERRDMLMFSLLDGDSLLERA